MTNFILGSLLSWPIGVWVGRTMTRYQGGTPIVPYQRFVHDFINLDPSKHARSTFRMYWLVTCAAGGILFASFTMDEKLKVNRWYNRFDLKPYPAMVPKEDLDITERTIMEAHY